MATHIDSWFAFVNKFGLGVDMEELILVTSCHRTKNWYSVAFHHDSRRVL